MIHHRTLPSKELRFALMFLLAFCTLQYAYLSGRDGIVEHLAIDAMTVAPSTALINLIAPGKQAVANGHRILSPHGSLSVLNGCEGTETLFLLSAAIFAFRTTWKNKLKGILLGAALVYVLNLARIVVLFFAAQNDTTSSPSVLANRNWFEAIHGYIAPSLIIALSSLFFLWWAHTTIHDESTRAA
ncbi:MAG: archaeosortase/exosortase family protein [Nitrosomonadales bacterium]|nr:archaeosortase/exosortase family protein [Nitrosomonadales bacterium]